MPEISCVCEGKWLRLKPHPETHNHITKSILLERRDLRQTAVPFALWNYVWYIKHLHRYIYIELWTEKKELGQRWITFNYLQS